MQTYFIPAVIGALAFLMVGLISGYCLSKLDKTLCKPHEEGPAPIRILGAMPESERRAAFREAPNSLLWRATLAELDELAIEVSDRSLNPTQSNEMLRWHAGGQDALLEFKARLQEREAQARRKESDSSEEPEQAA